MAIILSIETSCDETAVAIVEDRQVYSNVVASQIEIHRLYGGVVPEVASRQHLEVINSCIDQAFAQTNLQWEHIDAIAATVAPGLVGALLVGVTTGKTLAMLHHKPFLGVHHLEGHIYASYLAYPELSPPFLCLLVSGGHTNLIYVKDCGVYEMLGTTRDDAVGEAYDKVARLLCLGYPGGPIIDQLAQGGNPQAFILPEGRISLPEGGFHPYDFSFSGLKTAVLRLSQKISQEQELLPFADLCASFQHRVVKTLTKRTIKCALDHNLTKIVVGGGVAANKGLRNYLTAQAQAHNLSAYFPPLKFCTDNAAMIGCAGADHFKRGHVSSLSVTVQSRFNLTEVMNLYQ